MNSNNNDTEVILLVCVIIKDPWKYSRVISACMMLNLIVNEAMMGHLYLRAL